MSDQTENAEQNTKLANRYGLGALLSGFALGIATLGLLGTLYGHLRWQLGVGGFSGRPSDGFSMLILLTTAACLTLFIYFLSMYNSHKKK